MSKTRPRPAWTISRVLFPAGDYHHPPAGILQLRLVRRGSSYADIDLGGGVKRVFTRPGDLLLSLPDQPTAFRIDEAREVTIIQVQRDHAGALIGEAGGTLAELGLLLDRPMRDALLAEICRRLEEVPDSEAAYREWSLGLVLASLLRHARARAAAGRRHVLSHRRLSVVLQMIEERLALPLTVQDLARAAGFSSRVFAAAFREAMALPVHQYILQRRAERALQLLTSTAMPLAEVAQRAGFAHQAHMTKIVSRLKGATPGALRAKASK